MLLTENQQRALDFRHHLSVTANAGAGKTMVLVQRFLEILLRTDTRVDEVVAITFTDKAAGELKKKIAELIDKRMLSPESSATLHRLEYIRDQLTSANICTIHAFCAILLRQYPVEANIDAAFTVLEGVDQQILEQEAIRETFESLLRDNNDSREREEVLDVVRIVGQWNLLRTFEFLLRKREQLDRLTRKGGLLSEEYTSSEILERWNSMMISSVVHQIDGKNWKEQLEGILPRAKGKNAQEVAGVLRQWGETFSPEQKIEVYARIAQLIFTKDGTLRKDFTGPKALPESSNVEANLIQLHHSVREVIDNLLTPDGHRSNEILLRTTQIIFRIFKKILDTYEAKKQENGQLDFEDLQLRVRSLLQQEDIRRSLAEKYKFIMVDEYQDTNRLQYEIVRDLVMDFRAGNLFIVGDPKQSIYGFRNAEVEVFEATKKDIERSVTAPERNGSVTLPESFRPLINIVAFVNRVFSSLMNEGSPKNGFQYEALVRGRGDAAPGKVELMLIRDEVHEKTDETDTVQPDETVVHECEMIAQRIVDFKLSSYEIFDPQDGKRVPFQFNHAAILLRNRKHLTAIEKALVKFHIPYVLSGGIGFYQTQEILDFLNYFKFLSNPDDDVALVGVLRSPFFAISDAELFQISLSGIEESFWAKAQRRAQGTDATEFLQRAVKILYGDVDVARRLPVPFLVQRLFRNTGWHGTVLGATSGEQHVANIDKLLRLSREFASRSYTTLFDFVERLKTLVEEEQREGQASLETATQRVQVMTIHAAKGLEFPVVFLPFSHRKFRYDSSPYLDSELGIGYKVRDSLDLNKELDPPFYLYLRRASRQRIEEEEKRIFYVGCTRARDALIISGKMKSGAEYPSHLKWVLDSFKAKIPRDSGEVVFPESPVRILVPPDGTQLVREISHKLNISVSFWDNKKMMEHRSWISPEDPPLTREIHISPLQSQTKGDFFSATQIRTYLECPSKYFLKYRLGLPEDNRRVFDVDEEEDADDRLIGELEGSLTHTALQMIETNEFDEQNFRERIQALINVHVLGTEDERNKMVETVFSNTMRFVESAFGKKVLAAEEAKSEYSINTLFDDDFLTGTIDRLYKNETGIWSIVDYKTDHIGTNEIESKSITYKPQLMFYAFLVRKHFQQSHIPASLVFLRHADHPVQYDVREHDIDKFEKELRETIKRIKSGDFSRREALCKNCTYKRNEGCVIAP